MITMDDRDGVIWLDGEMMPWREAKVHVLTHTLHYGMGVFEGIRAYKTDNGTAIFRLKAHTDRLFNSAHILHMPMPYDKATINEVMCAVIRENQLETAYVRPMCFYGAEDMGLRAQGLKVHVMIAAWKWDKYIDNPESIKNGLRVATSSFTRHHVNITMCRTKSNGNYINSMLALQESVANGYDEAMLLDAEGYVAEGSGENIFLVHDGAIYTPLLTSALDGITRATICTLAQDMKIPVHEKLITRDEVYVSDEAFFTGTAIEVMPIREVDRLTIGKGQRGPITERLQSCYLDTVHGRIPEYNDWLTYV